MFPLRAASSPSNPPSAPRWRGVVAVTLPRVVLGLIFLLGAIDGFWYLGTGARLIHPPTSPAGEQFVAGLVAAGFFWPLMKFVELIGALCLLTNRAPALGLLLLSPLMAVIVLYQLVLNPAAGLGIAAVLLACGVALLRAYWPAYLPLFRPPARG